MNNKMLQRVSKINLIKKLLLVIVPALFLAGCQFAPLAPSAPPETEPVNQLNSQAAPYPVEAEVDQEITVKFELYDPTGTQSKPLPDQNYFRIMQSVPISDAKLKEGEGDCQPFHLHRYAPLLGSESSAATGALTQSSPATSLGAPKICPQTKTPVNLVKATLENMEIPYILRQNYRMEWIVTSEPPDQNPHVKPAEVIFVKREKTATSGNQKIHLFDIYLAKGSEEKLSVAEQRHDKTPPYPKLTLADVLQNCGSLYTTQKDQMKPGEIYLGGNQSQNTAPTTPAPTATLPQTLTVTKEQLLANLPENDSKRNDIQNIPGYVFSASFQKVENAEVSQHAGDLWKSLDTLPTAALQTGSTANPFAGSSFKLTYAINNANNTSQSAIIAISYQDQTVFYVTAQRAKVKFDPPVRAGGNQTLNVGYQPVTITPPEGDPWCGFTPESKPAIYLYPTFLSKIKVEIGPPIGKITVSDPPYPKDTGWQVLAMPNGTLFSQNKKFSHLYYEALTPTPSYPKEGWSTSYQKLPETLREISAKVGLNKKETRELVDYWTKKLPQSPYYLIGLLDRQEIDRLESLKITPEPQTLFRMRLLFVPIKQPTPIAPPATSGFARKGFTAVEWGGYLLEGPQP